MFSTMAAIAKNEAMIVAGELQGGSHLLIGQRPVAMEVVEIGGAILQEDAQRFGLLLGFPDQGGVDIAAADIRKTADVADDFAEFIRPLPGNGESADAAGGVSADGPAIGVSGDVQPLRGDGEQFFQQKAGVEIAEGVVLVGAIAAWSDAGRRGGNGAGIDEDADGDGQFAFGDEVIQHDGGAKGAVSFDEARAILEDHEAGRFRGIVLAWNVDPVVALGAGKDLAVVEGRLLHLALRDAGLHLGIWPELVVVGCQQRLAGKSKDGHDGREEAHAAQQSRSDAAWQAAGGPFHKACRWMIVGPSWTALFDMRLDPELLQRLAARVGAPFWIYDAAVLRRRIAEIRQITAGPGLQARFAMKACPATKVLREMHAAGIWIDAVSGNEVLRALHAGYSGGHQPPAILYTSDVFRDNARDVILQHGILPNIGSPGMLRDLEEAGFRGGVSLRVNPGFGHGHVNACDTGGPSSKHGIWHEDLGEVLKTAQKAGMSIRMLHAHIGSGPQFQELYDNLRRLAQEFGKLLAELPEIEAISLGGGIPFNYRDRETQIPLDPLREIFTEARNHLCTVAGRDIRVEIEPGRYYIAPACSLVTRVADVKTTCTNEKGRGVTFAMVDAGFVDLVRPAMYGSYHEIERVGDAAAEGEGEDYVVAGPLCESGDVFTRDDTELLVPRRLPAVGRGDLLAIRDAGAYGYAMSSNYNSVGRAPQLWLEEDGSVELISRRETLQDLLQSETSEALL